MSFSRIMSEVAVEYGLQLTEFQIAKLDLYFHMLVEWNQKINLTAITTPEEVAIKHMVDSLSCYDKDVFNEGCALIDVGTGAGFPGVPLKIIRPDIRLTLLDSLNKRVSFLQQLVNELELNDVFFAHSRAEDAGRNPNLRSGFDVATSRAVARMSVLSEFCLPFVRIGGCFIALKGSQYQEEIAEAKTAIKKLGGKIDKVRTISLPRIPDVRSVIYVRKITATPSIYPRRAGMPEKNPLT